MKKNIIFHLFFIIILLFNSVLVFAKENSTIKNDWELWKSSDDISLYYSNGKIINDTGSNDLKLTTSSNIVNIKATFTVRSSLSGFLLFIQDTDNVKLWLDNAYKSTIIRQTNQTENVFVTYFSGIWPVQPRHTVMKTKIKQHADLSIDIYSEDAGTSLTMLDDSVQMKVLDAHWHIAPIKKTDLIRVEYTLSIDPKSELPWAMLNELALNSMDNTIINIKTLLPNSPWQTFSFQHIQEDATKP